MTSGRPVAPAILPTQLLAPAREDIISHQRMDVGNVPVLAVASPVGPTMASTSSCSAGRARQQRSVLEQDSGRGYRVERTGRNRVGSVGESACLASADRVHCCRCAGGSGRVASRLSEQSDPDLAPLAATFNATSTALEQRVRGDARFAGDVSHELRSPLTTLVNVSEVLQRWRAELPSTAR
jgi:two-component system sensor histidine kinase MtrB